MIFNLLRRDKKSDVLNCSAHMCTEEYAERMFDLYLTDQFERDEDGNVLTRYRLHAKYPHTVDMALQYTIHCPKCRGFLKQIGRTKNFHELGLYKCPACDNELKHGGRR